MTLTLEELELIENIARRDARKQANHVLRRYRNASLAGFLALCVGVGAAFAVIGRNQHEACVSGNHSRQVLRAILADSQRTETNSAAFNGFYRRSVRLLEDRSC